MFLPPGQRQAHRQDRRRIPRYQGRHFLPQRSAQRQEAFLAGPGRRPGQAGPVGPAAVLHHREPPGSGRRSEGAAGARSLRPRRLHKRTVPQRRGVTPLACHCEERSDVAISSKTDESVAISLNIECPRCSMLIGILCCYIFCWRLPRQCAHWLAMTSKVRKDHLCT